ncbi:lysosomal amino acid transporter 1 homolog isoform X2 [Bubalus kerabau]|uniref:lysosomal amino acid transporter 1 homolog isoform X5 n=1 Tax=Bubalus bubalis TaxID=89462 RepID=UPI000DBC9C9C|nr:lysosomal amino acid transporter 1 homolog isoform X5 [Bubalus bubalis]XP_055430273.1 lysosomal amino acid transporter 1 homolog isoform X2 [Bubalus carabanensis]
MQALPGPGIEPVSPALSRLLPQHKAPSPRPSEAMVWVKLGSSNFSSCPNGSSQWIWDVLGECAQDGWDKASVGLGLLSILCFAASTFPQYIKACKTGNMDQALSLWFLLGWIGGDSCNLIGSFLADQLPLQTYTAVYYVLADVLMLSLYFYYKFKKRPSPWSAPINSLLLFILGVACTTPLLRSAGSVAVPREVFQGRTLLSVEPSNKPFTRKEIIGFVIGSVSSALYLFSRLPQIRTNFLRKSTQGISYSLFALVMLGNTLYGLSVLLKNPEEGQSEGSYVLHHLPWLVGSLGVLLLDTIISVQFFLYRHAAPSPERQPLLPS